MFSHQIADGLSLRLLTPQDGPRLFALTDASRGHLRPWLPWVDAVKGPENSLNFISMTLRQFASNNGFQAGIWEHGQLAGVIGLHGIDWTNRWTSIGYWLGAPFQGRGIMSRSTKAVVDIAIGEYGLNRVEIRVATENHRSRAIPERLGFIREGHIHEAEWLHDHFVDHIVFGMVASRWPACRPPD